MFSHLDPCAVSADAIEALVSIMRRHDPSAPNSRIPAGFTYLGQFIDHDVTFDPTSALERSADPEAIRNFRTPRLDLDSVYGSGPVVQPYLYDWSTPEAPGTRMLVGRGAGGGIEDLPRNHQGRALIADPRNDENVIVSQLHLLFLRFHNAVVDHLTRVEPEGEERRFKRAQRLVRWHYQWIVVHEFLPRIVGPEMARRVFEPGADGAAPVVRREHFTGDRSFIPREFSGAAYRFGHSMVREHYGLKKLARNGAAARGLAVMPDLAGLTWLRPELVVDWERFFRLPGFEDQVQPSQAINTSIVGPLFGLTEGERELPRRNLQRAAKLELPSGQAVARAMGQHCLPEEALQLEGLPQPLHRQLLEATPLWYYLLCEAGSRTGAAGPGPAGRHLGPVGGRIVAEVLVGLLEGDQTSFLRKNPTWRPHELGTSGTFAMADLVRIARDGVG